MSGKSLIERNNNSCLPEESYSFTFEGTLEYSNSFTSVSHLRFFVRLLERISQKDKCFNIKNND
jgi:hypothetical protein